MTAWLPRVGRVAGGQPTVPGRAGPGNERHAAPVAERGDVPGAVWQPAQRPPRRAAQVPFDKTKHEALNSTAARVVKPLHPFQHARVLIKCGSVMNDTCFVRVVLNPKPFSTSTWGRWAPAVQQADGQQPIRLCALAAVECVSLHCPVFQSQSWCHPMRSAQAGGPAAADVAPERGRAAADAGADAARRRRARRRPAADAVPAPLPHPARPAGASPLGNKALG